MQREVADILKLLSAMVIEAVTTEAPSSTFEKFSIRLRRRFLSAWTC
jgi:hypothetical protein